MLARDIRHALRTLRRSPGFAAIAIASLAIALALNAMMFAILDAVVHPYVPYRNADALYWVRTLGGPLNRRARPGAYASYLAVRDASQLFRAVTLVSMSRMRLVVGHDDREVFVQRITPELTSILGVEPVRGRFFSTRDAATDASVVVLSWEAWRRMFPGRESLDGASLLLDGRGYAVVGILPRGITSPLWGGIYLPLDTARLATGTESGTTIVELRPGVTLARANAALASVARRLTTVYHAEDNPFTVDLRTLRPDPMRLRDFHWAMAGAALAVLLIACANLANLMLARGITRRRELALRLALGASRRTLVRQMVIEAAVLALGGAAAGALLAWWGGAIVAARVPPEMEWIGILAPHLSWRVFAFGLAATALTVLLFGLLPAVRASDVDVSEPLKDGAGTTTGRMRGRYSALVVAEVALSLVLLMAAGLLTRAAARLTFFDFGYDAQRLWRVDPGLPWRTTMPGREAIALYAGLLDRLRHIEGIRDAAWGHGMAVTGDMVTSEGADGARRQLLVRGVLAVSPGFLRTKGVGIVRGRDFLDGDALATGGVIVDELAARRLWPRGADPVGRMLKLGDAESGARWLPVLGVARQVRDFSAEPFADPDPVIYVVIPNDSAVHRTLVVHVAREDDAALAERVRRMLRATVPGASWGFVFISPYSEGAEDMARVRAFLAGIFSTFSAFALLLAAVGLYGVLAYSVGQRMREFGVRVALGARPADLLRLVLHEGAVMLLAGTAIGALFAMWAGTLLDAWLYDVYHTDAVALVSSEAMLVGVALLACLIPALRASRADPMEILRAS